MNRAFVLDKNKKPLMPCHPARARKFLNEGKAKIFRCHPFTIILIQREDGDIQPIECKIDPGSKTTGVVVAAQSKKGHKVLWSANLEHRGDKVREALESRRANRRSRRQRKTRYRQPRFKNRARKKGWLAPSLESRVKNVVTMMSRLQRLAPITQAAVETVRFDTQKLQNPEISGVEYQQGELFGYEVREYLLEKWQRTCAYCGKTNIPLEIEHITPKSRGGSDIISNLTLACRPCNQKKGNLSVTAFVKSAATLAKLTAKAKAPLKDAAAVNSTRFALLKELKALTPNVSSWTGGRTKFNRIKQGYSKDHWIDAACVGESGSKVFIPPSMSPLHIKAMGRGSRQKCRVDAYGFPRTSPKSAKQVFGFRTGDLVKAVVPKGKQSGTHVGRVAIRTTGNFNIKTARCTVQGISHRFCRPVQRSDGYFYTHSQGSFLLPLKGEVSAALLLRENN